MSETNTENQRSTDSTSTDKANEEKVKTVKSWRVELDGILQKIKARTAPGAEGQFSSRHTSLMITHIEDAIMRGGMQLKELNEPSPYPNSYNPDNAIVDKTADGLKL